MDASRRRGGGLETAAAAAAAAGPLIYALRRLCQWIYILIFIIRNIIATRVYYVSREYDEPAELASSRLPVLVGGASVGPDPSPSHWPHPDPLVPARLSRRA